MSGAGLVGAQPKVDIVTKNVSYDNIAHTAKRHSDVAVTVPINPGFSIVIGIQVRKKQAAGATLVITNPPTMPVVKEAPIPPGPEVKKLEKAFPSEAGYRWVAFTGTVPPPPPGPPPVVTNLQTELTVDTSELATHGFQVIPVVVHYGLNTDWEPNHYLIGASIIPGPAQFAVPMRAPRGVGQYAKSAKKGPRPKKKKKR